MNFGSVKAIYNFLVINTLHSTDGILRADGRNPFFKRQCKTFHDCLVI